MSSNKQVREDLAAAMRTLAGHGLQEGISSNCSAFAPAKSGNGEVILFAPLGLLWEDATPDNFVGIDFQTGKVVEGDPNSDPFGHKVHLPIYRSRPDVKSIFHCHTKYGNALSCLKDYHIKMLNQNSCRFIDDIAYFQFRLLQSEAAAGIEAASTLGDKTGMVLRHHGLIAVGPCVSLAFDSMYALETACKYQALALSCGRELDEISDEVARGVKKDGESMLEAESRLHLDACKRHYKVAEL